MQSMGVGKSNITWTLSLRSGATLVEEMRWQGSPARGNGEYTFLQVESQPVGSEDGDQWPQVRPVLIPGFALHAVII
jgi:hypothetical protein